MRLGKTGLGGARKFLQKKAMSRMPIAWAGTAGPYSAHASRGLALQWEGEAALRAVLLPHLDERVCWAVVPGLALGMDIQQAVWLFATYEWMERRHQVRVECRSATAPRENRVQW
jgi:hypothetical protein